MQARPAFRGHYQPHLPADLGFYDLRLTEVREAQAELARQYGIFGFCYYHYWFNGRRPLARQLDDVLASGKPNFPFCVCWANEDWTRAWDGRSGEILTPSATVRMIAATSTGWLPFWPTTATSGSTAGLGRHGEVGVIHVGPDDETIGLGTVEIDRTRAPGAC